jgi:hypothetical protein
MAQIPLDQNKAPPPPSGDKTPFWTDAKFWIAFTIIIGLIAILIIVVAQAQYTQASTLAGIFSGWITSIVAFYFYGGTTTNAQNQIATSHQTAINAQNQAVASTNTINKIKGLKATYDSSKQRITDLEKRSAIKSDIAQQQRSEISEATWKELENILSQA